MLGRLLDLIPHYTIPVDGKPYLTRYYLTGRNEKEIGARPNLFLHHFHASDQGRELHNHPYTGTSLVLRGGYIEERMTDLADAWREDTKILFEGEPTYEATAAYGEVETNIFYPGEFNKLGLHDFHRVELRDKVKGAWTLFMTGPRVKEWGFLDRNTLEFFPYESARAERLGSGPYTRELEPAQAQALKDLDDEVTAVLKSHETPGRVAQALRLRRQEKT